MLLVGGQENVIAARERSSTYLPNPYDWIPDLPDHRDLPYGAPRRVLVKPPLEIDLRPDNPPPDWNGAELTSATHAIRHACRLAAGNGACPFEALLTPAIGREASIRDVLKSAARQLANARGLSAGSGKANGPWSANGGCFPVYLRIPQTLAQLKGCLVEGNGFIFGFSVFESFESPAVVRSGRIHMPDHKERMLGGISALALGFDDATRTFTVMLGKSAPTYRQLPYSYLTDPHLAADFWTMRLTDGQ